jgi:hypothetical protein
MAQLTGGIRAGLSGRAGAGWLWLGKPAALVMVAGGVRAVSLRIVPRAGVVPGVGAVRWGSLRIVPAVAATWAAWGGRHGRGLTINRRPLSPKISSLRAGRGPGPAAGEFSVPLPAVWLEMEFPAAFIGRDLAALALLRGESWALSGQVLSVGGRVLVGEVGDEVLFAGAEDVEGWIADRYAELARYLGALGLPQGARRDAVLSKYRRLAAVAVRSGAKYARGVGDDARRAALLADLRWLERRV